MLMLTGFFWQHNGLECFSNIFRTSILTIPEDTAWQAAAQAAPSFDTSSGSPLSATL
jgi:hypothetical protein